MNRAIRENHLLGILVCRTRQDPPFAERGYYEQLSRIGNKMNISVIVFSPKDVDWSKRHVHGYVYNLSLNKWSVHHSPLPAVIYDRCFYMSPVHYKSYQPFVQKLRRDPQTELLGVPLRGKWQLAELVASSSVSRYLPHTERYTKPQDALKYIQKYKAVVAKPSGGSHGRGVVAVFRKTEKEPCNIVGRTQGNAHMSHTFSDTNQALAWLHRFIGSRSYILQPYLHLRTPDHLPFDIRVLMQKDELQSWQLTGMAVRTGNAHSLTSNLHGGGKAEKITPFLEKICANKQTATQVEQEIYTLCHRVTRLIEHEHGRLCELGVDIGVDSRGRVWLLEVNSKPGRQVFRQAGEREMYVTAIRRPMLYARALLQGSRHWHS